MNEALRLVHAEPRRDAGETLARTETELMVMVEGNDETTMQVMQARHSWPSTMIRWNHKYVDLLYQEGGVTHLDYGVFDDIEPL